MFYGVMYVAFFIGGAACIVPIFQSGQWVLFGLVVALTIFSFIGSMLWLFDGVDGLKKWLNIKSPSKEPIEIPDHYQRKHVQDIVNNAKYELLERRLDYLEFKIDNPNGVLETKNMNRQIIYQQIINNTKLTVTVPLRLDYLPWCYDINDYISDLKYVKHDPEIDMNDVVKNKYDSISFIQRSVTVNYNDEQINTYKRVKFIINWDLKSCDLLWEYDLEDEKEEI